MVALFDELWFNAGMSIRKSEAIEVLGGSVSAAAEAMHITYQAVDKWPVVLSNRISDRVLAAWTRKYIENIPAPFKRQLTPKRKQEATV